MKSTKKIREGVTQFFTQPISPIPLGIYRITIGLFGMIQAALLFPDWVNFFGREGYIQWEISKALNHAWHIHISDVYGWVESTGMLDTDFVIVFFWIYMISLAGLTLGWYTRVWGILSWACHYVIMSSLPTFTYGVDIFLHISLFYMMVMPVGKALSLDVRQGRTSPLPDWTSTLAIRVFQIHLCLVYISAGYEKMLYANWWEGNVLWRAIAQPDFRQFNMDWLAYYPLVPMVLSWFTMFIETFYFIGMWIKQVRVYWLLAIIGLHVGIGIFVGLYLFSLMMIFLSISAFGYDAWKDYQTWKKPLFSRKPLSRTPQASPAMVALQEVQP